MIRRVSSDAGGLRPEVVNILSAIPREASAHAARGMRPPKGAYNASLREVVMAFEQSLDAIDELCAARAWASEPVQRGIVAPQSSVSWDSKFVQAIERLLYTMVEHIEHSRGILACLLPDAPAFAKHPVVRTYDKGIAFYRKHVGAIVNGIKHGQRRLRGFVMYDDTVAIPGFYVEMVGSIGPSNTPFMHPDPKFHRDGNTALSTHRELRLHFVYIFYTARHLATAIEALRVANAEPQPGIDQDSDARLLTIARRIAALPVAFFPNEVDESVPAVGAGEDGLIGTLWVDYPSARLHPYSLKRARCTVAFVSDGETHMVKVPYAPKGLSAKGDVPGV